jgi:ATP-binding cassette subfamily C protein
MLGSLVLVSGVLAAASTGYGTVIAGRLFETVLAELREDLVAQAFRLPQGLVEEAGTGDLVSRTSDDVTQVSDAAPRIIPAVTGAGFTILVTLLGTAALHWSFALVLLLLVPLYVVTLRWYLRTAPAVYAAERAAAAERAHHLLAALRGAGTVHAFRAERVHLDRISHASWEMVRWTMRARTVQNMFFGRLNLAEFVGVALLLVVGYLAVVDGHVGIGTATAALLMFLRLFDPIGQLLLVIDDAQSAAASLARIVGVRDAGTPTSRSAPTGAAPANARNMTSGDAPEQERRVCLGGVAFSYRPDVPVLQDVDLTVDNGNTHALVGASGAGKSTIAALLAGIHEPDRGHVRVPERTVLLTQENHVFTGTLRENLTLAGPGTEDTDLAAALDAVGLTPGEPDFPEGLDTVLGQGGLPLTAARAARLALARVIVADPDLVILDEATAEADSADAEGLDRAAAAVTGSRTAVVIAHRLSQAAASDTVTVMAHGRVVQTGPPAQLQVAPGPYADFWRAWEAGGRRPPDGGQA